MSETRKYRFELTFTVIGDSTKSAVLTYILTKLRDLKAKGKVEAGNYSIIELVAVEPIREQGEI